MSPKQLLKDYKSNDTRKKNNSNLQCSLLQAAPICASYFNFFSFSLLNFSPFFFPLLFV